MARSFDVPSSARWLPRIRATVPSTRRWLAAVVLASVLAVAAPGVLAAAATRIGINGGRPSQWPVVDQVMALNGFTQQAWLQFASQAGENWLPGTLPVPLEYPAQLGVVSGWGALTVDQSTAVGQQLLHATLLREIAAANGEPVHVVGLSEGTLVIERELDYLRTATDAPDPKDVTFYVFGDMQRGVGDMYLRGLTIPFIGQTFRPVPESKYDVVVVNEQWDGWAIAPDRPWNAIAVVNAIMGAVYTVNGTNDHSRTALDSLDDAVLMSEVTSQAGGTTKTYMVPRSELPITRPLRQLGIPGWVVDEIDKMLMPIVAYGYSYLTPTMGPHFVSGGQLVLGNAVPAPLPNPGTPASLSAAPAVTEPTSAAKPAVTSVTAAVQPAVDSRTAAPVQGAPEAPVATAVADSPEGDAQVVDRPATTPDRESPGTGTGTGTDTDAGTAADGSPAADTVDAKKAARTERNGGSKTAAAPKAPKKTQQGGTAAKSATSAGAAKPAGAGEGSAQRSDD